MNLFVWNWNFCLGVLAGRLASGMVVGKFGVLCYWKNSLYRIRLFSALLVMYWFEPLVVV